MAVVFSSIGAGQTVVTNPGPYSRGLAATIERNFDGKGWWVTFGVVGYFGIGSESGSQFANTLSLAKRIASHYVTTGEWRRFGARMR